MHTFFVFYQICLVVFVIQGVGLPAFTVVSFIVSMRQEKRLAILKRMADASAAVVANAHAEEEAKKSRRGRRRAVSILGNLPRLEPLKCANCGAGVLLEETGTRCPNCQSKAALPEDYAMAVSLRTRVRKLVKRAILQWRVAAVLTSRFVAKMFFAFIFIEPLVLLMTVFIGSAEFRKSWLDRIADAMESNGQILTNVVIALGFVGVFVGMITFILLANWRSNVSRKLPLVPDLSGERQASETANCQSCGGCIQYESGDFGTICGYCHVENYRVDFAHWDRVKSEGRKAEATFTLFAALDIVNDFLVTFWIISGIVYFGFLLLILSAAAKHF